MYFLEDEAVVIDDVRFLGCTLFVDFDRFDWTVMRECLEKINDFRAIAGRQTCRQFYDRHQCSKAFLDDELAQEFEGKTVVVTHYAPSEQSTKNVFGDGKRFPSGDLANYYYFSDLESLVLEHQPELWIHGHTHYVTDYQIDKTRVVSNPSGYIGEPGGLVDGFNAAGVYEV